MIDVLSGNFIRARQALLTALFSTAHAQFSLANDLIEDVGETFRHTGPVGDRTAVIETIVTRFRDRTQRTITELRRISDELHDNSQAAFTTPPAPATAAMPAERTVDAGHPAVAGEFAGQAR